MKSARRVVELTQTYDCVWGTVGVHPHDADTDYDLKELRQLASNEKIVAIGETGLDFYRDWSPKDDQYRAFRRQIELALELDLPLVIHSRDAGKECLQVLKEMQAERVGGVFHCYSEDQFFAATLLEMNFLVSFTGNVTFKNATELQAVAKDVPLEQMMLETDAPYMAPVPYRGKKCESAFLVETARFLAELKQVDLIEFSEIVWNTTEKFFRFPQN